MQQPASLTTASLSWRYVTFLKNEVLARNEQGILTHEPSGTPSRALILGSSKFRNFWVFISFFIQFS